MSEHEFSENIFTRLLGVFIKYLIINKHLPYLNGRLSNIRIDFDKLPTTSDSRKLCT